MLNCKIVDYAEIKGNQKRKIVRHGEEAHSTQVPVKEMEKQRRREN
jgi:pyrrolidone-carboxylate peptidase